MYRTTLTTLAVLLLSLFAFPDATKAHGDDDHSGGTSDDPAAMMAAWQKAATPGEEHAELAKQTGDWQATVKVWMAPGAEPQVSQGKFHRELTLDGRVMLESFEGSFGGQPFRGAGQTGFDNATGRWWTTWTDNMSTGVTVMWGKWSKKEGGVVYYGTSPDPMGGKMIKVKSIVRNPDDGQEEIEMFDLRSGEAVKTMEIISTRE